MPKTEKEKHGKNDTDSNKEGVDNKTEKDKHKASKELSETEQNDDKQSKTDGNNTEDNPNIPNDE